MKRAVVSGLILAVIFFVILVSLKSPPRTKAQVLPSVVYSNAFPIPGSLPAPSAPFDLFHLVLEIPPGGRTGSHSHPFGCVQTVLQGQAALRIGNNAFFAAPGRG